MDFHTYAVTVHCTHYNNPSVIFVRQLHSTSEYCRKATKTNFIICGFTRPATECTIHHNRGEHAYCMFHERSVCVVYFVLILSIARWLETSFPKFNRQEYYTAVSYIIRLGNVRTFKIIWSSKENMVQFFRNQGQRSKTIFHTKIHWIPNFN